MPTTTETDDQDLKAFRAWHDTWGGNAIIMAASAGKARASLHRTLNDHYPNAEFTECNVRRAPQFDMISEHDRVQCGIPYDRTYAKRYRLELE